MMKLSPKAIGLASAILGAAFWLVVMIFSLATGIGEITLTTIGSFHPFFTYSFIGMIIITIEHFIGCYIFGWLFAWLYNKFVK